MGAAYLPVEPGIPFPAPGQIDCYVLPLSPDPRLLQRCTEALTPQEAEHSGQFGFEQLKWNYRISQGGLRLLLSAYLGTPPADIQFARHAKGKPFLREHPGLFFNLSNSGDWVIYAFSSSGEIGIDLESMRELEDMEELISRSFTEKEGNYIRRKEEESRRRFFKFWTVKEAYLKAAGEGMRTPPEGLEFSVSGDDFRLDTVNGVQEMQDWYFSHLEVDQRHIGTLVHSWEDLTIRKMNF